jgi:dihydrofolate reductase
VPAHRQHCDHGGQQPGNSEHPPTDRYPEGKGLKPPAHEPPGDRNGDDKCDANIFLLKLNTTSRVKSQTNGTRIVVTHRNLPIERQNITAYSGDFNKLVDERLKPNYRNVWLVGGPILSKDFIVLKLADEIRLSVLPVILGDGTLFFDHIGGEQALHLMDVTAYKSGMVKLRYKIRK